MATQRDKKSMLSELADKGYPVDVEAMQAPFNFLISAVASVDVDATPIIKFSQRMRTTILQSTFACELAGIIVFPMVLHPEIRSTGDKITWKRGERIYVIRRTIDYFAWQHANSNAKKKMLMACVVDSIASIPVKHLSESSKEPLVKLAHQAMRSSARRLSVS